MTDTIVRTFRDRPGGSIRDRHLQCQGVPEPASAGLLGTLEPLMSIEEAAGVLAISPRGVYRLIERSDLVPVKVGGCTRIEPQELRRYIAERRKSSQLEEVRHG